MASAAEQLAANLNFGALAKADELKQKTASNVNTLDIFFSSVQFNYSLKSNSEFLNHSNTFTCPFSDALSIVAYVYLNL